MYCHAVGGPRSTCPRAPCAEATQGLPVYNASQSPKQTWTLCRKNYMQGIAIVSISDRHSSSATKAMKEEADGLDNKLAVLVVNACSHLCINWTEEWSWMRLLVFNFLGFRETWKLVDV